MQFFEMSCSYGCSVTCPSVLFMWSLLACCSLEQEEDFVMMVLLDFLFVLIVAAALRICVSDV